MVLVAAVLLARLNDPPGPRPDSWSEVEVIISGWGYAASGFLAYAGLPQHQISPPVDPYYLYANYPVLSNVLYGVLHLLGADAYGLYRLPAILASLAALWLWYQLVTKVVDRATGMAAVIALASSVGFLSYADNIHQQAYPMAPQFGALVCLVSALAPETKRPRRWLIGCALCLFVVGLLTVELHAWLIIAVAGYVMLFSPRARWQWLPVLIAPLLVGVALQSLQGKIGSPVPPEERPSFGENLYRRSIGFADAIDTPRDAEGKRLTLATFPGYMVDRFNDFYRVPAWVVPLLILIGFVGAGTPRAPPTQWPPQVKLLLILLLAALGWMGTMMQQTAVHPATLRQLLPFWALLLAVVWTHGVRVALDPRVFVVWRVLLPLVAVALMVPQAAGMWAGLRMHWDHRFRDPVIMEAPWSEPVDLGRLRSLPADSVILTNHNRLPFIRYWSRRPTYTAFNTVPPGIPVRRTSFDLSMSYLRGLYAEKLPHLVFLYRIFGPTPQNIAATLAQDPLLRILTTGSLDPLPSDDAERRAVRAFRGEEPAACPVLLRGGSWSVFDMTPIMPELMRRFSAEPVPKLREMPAPR